MTDSKPGYCANCEAQRLGQRETLSDLGGCALTLLTGGLFLIIWLPYRWFIEARRPYRCPQCGGELT